MSHNYVHRLQTACATTMSALLIVGATIAPSAFGNGVSTNSSDSVGKSNSVDSDNAAQPTTPPEDSEAMYRLYNPNSGEHFYTGNFYEQQNLLLQHWRDEGIGWYAPLQSDTPVYRLFNPNVGDHHYTTSEGERDALVAVGWRDEGIGWYSDDDETVPLYRQYNPNATTGMHNYTTGKAENDMLVSKGWHAEGIGWYALAEGQPQQPVTFEEDKSYASIEGMIDLRGTGTGYHAKLDISAGNGVVVSFGIQYEKDIHLGYPQFPGNVVYLIENVMSNFTEPGPVGKEYLYLDAAELNKPTKVRLSWYDDDTVRVYVEDHEIGRTRTTLKPPFIFSVEGSVARNGDSINASVSNVRIKTGNDQTSFGTMGEWNNSFNYFGLVNVISKYGEKKDDQDSYATHGGHTFGADFIITGTANIPGNGPDGQPWTWDTSFSAVEPNTHETGRPLSAIANLAQFREADPEDNASSPTDSDMTDNTNNNNDGNGTNAAQ